MPTDSDPAVGTKHVTLDRIVVLLLFFFSGFSALVYELVWSQQFALVFGASATATTAVLAAYMCGLGVGAGLVGRLVHAIRRPVLWYGALECAIGLSALVVAPALEVARSAHVAFFRWVALEGASSAGFYLLCSFVILVVPTAAMGATLPLLVRFWVASREQISRGVAALYFANTLGAAFGTVAAAFLLVPRLGLGRALAVAVTVNLSVALLVLLRYRSRPAANETSKIDLPAESRNDRRERRSVYLILALVCASGWAGMSYEVFWTRLLTVPLGGSLYAFATMLATFLVGIALGSSATLARRWTRSAAWAGFGLAQVGLGLCGPLAIVALEQRWIVAISEPGLTVRSIVLLSLTLAPCALFLGAAFPLAVRVASDDAMQAARASSLVYASNTVGTIGGAVLAGFWLLPRRGFEGTLQVLTVVCLLVSSLALWRAQARWRRGALAAGLLAAGVLFWTPPVPWSLLGSSSFLEGFEPSQARYLGVGRSATIMLSGSGAELRLTSDGRPESSVQAPGTRTARYAVARWLALLPSTLRPSAQRAMVIGLGAGITVASFPPYVGQIDVAEIEPEIIRANRSVAAWRMQDPLRDPRAHLIVDDARDVLSTRLQRYDIIVSQPSHPWTLGAASLFTREFAALVASRLTDSGVFVQWLAVTFIDEQLLRSQVATLLAELPYVEVLRPPASGAVLLVASRAPIDLEEGLEKSWLSVAPAWRSAGVVSASEILVARWLDADGARELAEGATISTDYRNLLMIRSPKLVDEGGRRVFPRTAELDAIRDLQAGRDDLYPIRMALAAGQLGRVGAALESVSNPDLRRVGLALWELARGRRARGLAVLRRESLRSSGRVEALAALLDAYSSGGVAPPEAVAEQLETVPELRDTYRAWLASRSGHPEAAAALDARLAEIAPEHPAYRLAAWLRVRWRELVGGVARSREALELLEPQITVGSGMPTLLLRARLADAAEDEDAVFASLWEASDSPAEHRGAPSPALKALVKELGAKPERRGDPRWRSLLQAVGSSRAPDTSLASDTSLTR